jgi:hypothetical protein
MSVLENQSIVPPASIIHADTQQWDQNRIAVYCCAHCGCQMQGSLPFDFRVNQESAS